MHADVLERIMYGILTSKGCILLSGEYGCGKTSIIREVIQRLDPVKYEVALINYPMFEQGEFLREVLFQYGVEAQAGSRLELFRRISGLALENVTAGKRNLIIIDEAQLLENADDFEQLRMLLNIQMNTQNILTILLVGQPELRELVMRYPQLDQRINVRCHLSYFDLPNTSAYIQHRLRVAGAMREIFTRDAQETVYQLTHGAPRRVNNVCDMSLFEGCSIKAARITDDIVRRVT